LAFIIRIYHDARSSECQIIMNLWVSYNSGNFLSSWGSMGLSWRSSFHAVSWFHLSIMIERPCLQGDHHFTSIVWLTVVCLNSVLGHGILSAFLGLSRKNRDRWSPYMYANIPAVRTSVTAALDNSE